MYVMRNELLESQVMADLPNIDHTLAQLKIYSYSYILSTDLH